MSRFLFLAGRDPKHPQAGGGDLIAWDAARYAAEEAHRVTYICSSHPMLPASECVDGVQVLRVGTGVRLPLRAFTFYQRHRRGFDVVYEDVVGGSRPPFLTPLFVHQPIVVGWHQVSRELFHQMFPRPLASALSHAERLLARLYRRTRVRALSEERRLELHREFGLPLDRMRVIPVSIPEDWFVGAVSEPAASDAVLCLGNLRPYKGFHLAIEALSRMLQECPHARLIIAGRRCDPVYEQRLRDLVTALGLGDRVEFRLDITEDEKRALIDRSRVLALPSRLEGFGIVVLEANARGVPVVASSGVPELAVRHEFNGLRYPRDDVAGLAESIVRLLKDRDLHGRLSANGLAHARRFGWRQIGAEFEAFMCESAAIYSREYALAPALSSHGGQSRE